MKILNKNVFIFIMAIFLTFVMGGCLDFAQTKSNFDQSPLRTSHDGGEKITIVMQGIPPEEAQEIVKDILKRIKEQEEGINNE